MDPAKGAVDPGPGGRAGPVVQDAESGSAPTHRRCWTGRRGSGCSASRAQLRRQPVMPRPGSRAARSDARITGSGPRLPREAPTRASMSSTDGALTTAGCRARSAPTRRIQGKGHRIQVQGLGSAAPCTRGSRPCCRRAHISEEKERRGREGEGAAAGSLFWGAAAGRRHR
jgi:hypothetical protein